MSLRVVNNSKKVSVSAIKAGGYFFNLIPKFYFLSHSWFTYSLPVVFSRFLITCCFNSVPDQRTHHEPNENQALPFLRYNSRALRYQNECSVHFGWRFCGLPRIESYVYLCYWIIITLIFILKTCIEIMQQHQFESFFKSHFRLSDVNWSLHEVLFTMFWEQGCTLNFAAAFHYEQFPLQCFES